MSDFPQSHTTTTTTTTVTGGRIHLDTASIKTIPGILRIAEIVLCLITFICAVSACTSGYFSTSHPECGWAGFVSFIGLLLVIGWLVFYLLSVNEALPNLPWHLVELGVYATWTFFFFTAGIALSVLSSNMANLRPAEQSVHAGAGAGAFFAFATMLVFGFHSFLIFRDWRRQVGSSPQGAQGRA